MAKKNTFFYATVDVWGELSFSPSNDKDARLNVFSADPEVLLAGFGKGHWNIRYVWCLLQKRNRMIPPVW